MTTSIAATASLTSPAVDLDLISGRLTLDENWSPYAQGSIVCTLPSAAELLDLDPRDNRQVLTTFRQSSGRHSIAADLTERYTGSTAATLTTEFVGLTAADLTRMFYDSFDPAVQGYEPPKIRESLLCLRSREIDYLADTVTFELASEESILQDNALVAAAPFTPPGTYLYEIVDYVLALSDLTVSFSDAAVRDVLADPLLVAWEPGETSWDYLMRILGSIQLWVTERGVWNLFARRPTNDAALTLDPSVNLTRATDTISRDADWYTAALITYEWVDANGVDQTEYDFYSTPGYPAKVFTETREFPYPGPGLAARYCARFVARGRRRDLTAVVDWEAQTAQLVNVTLPRGETYRAIVSALTFEYPADTMTVKTRDLTTEF